MTDAAHDDLMTTSELMRAYPTRSQSWFWRRFCSGAIPAKQFGKQWLARKVDVDAYMATFARSKP